MNKEIEESKREIEGTFPEIGSKLWGTEHRHIMSEQDKCAVFAMRTNRRRGESVGGLL